MRELMLAIQYAGLSNNPIIQNFRQQYLLPLLSSEYCYLSLDNTHGHVRACRRTGNNRATALQGYDLFLLAFY